MPNDIAAVIHRLHTGLVPVAPLPLGTPLIWDDTTVPAESCAGNHSPGGTAPEVRRAVPYGGRRWALRG
ncbi:hypothetical protein CEP50_18950 [Actinopolyspora mortivallis]|uniref:Uncharacterized protein n=1 Tax=Actinopolyspora mortivallis TaxID=33906 RepID=A0A2T0GRM9_ACTMO|nr:hypothetical protein CEP50_18950 [Actinopolyspora mortivallis]